jgi:predicted ferric reductase
LASRRFGSPPENCEDFSGGKKIHKKQARALRGARSSLNLKRRKVMLWTIFVILLILWLLGLVSGYALGGFIHILLVIAVVVLIINLVSGRRGI